MTIYYLLLNGGWEFIQCVVMLGLLVIDVVDVGAVGQEEQLREVVEHHTDAVVVEGVPKPVLVAVVHPLAHPSHWLRLAIFTLMRALRYEITALSIYSNPKKKHLLLAHLRYQWGMETLLSLIWMHVNFALGSGTVSISYIEQRATPAHRDMDSRCLIGES